MLVSFNQASSAKIKDNNGFGYAAKMCKESLTTLGHQVSWRDSNADVELNFIQPQHWHWTGPYRIGYVPWESTTLREGWVEAMNEVDEVWTPSPVVAQWFRDAGVKKQVKVYQHGVDPIWTPKQRSTIGRYRAFHHGAEGIRKGGEMAFASFQNVLWEEYATMVFKMILANFAVRGSHRVEVHPGRATVQELVNLYHSCHLMIYPSWGEGFGLTPLQAMATGMPVLITEGWAPYQYLLKEHNLISSKLTDSPADWQEVHPGKMFKPDFNDLVEKLRYQWENREELIVESYNLAKKVHEDYSWLDHTERAFSHLV